MGKSLSGSLLGIWAHFANGSSRSRLCWTWLRNAGSSPVGGAFGGQETCDEFLKFQVSGPPAVLLHSRKKLPEPWKPEAQVRGWGTPRIPRLGCLPRLRLLRPPIALPSNSSLALQASSCIALLGDLEVRVPNEVAALGVCSAAVRPATGHRRDTTPRTCRSCRWPTAADRSTPGCQTRPPLRCERDRSRPRGSGESPWE